MNDSSPQIAPGVIAASAAMIILSMTYFGGLAGAPLQLLVQTAPLWTLAVLGWRGGGYVRWAALPLLGFWAMVCAAVVSDRAGWSHLVNVLLSERQVHLVVFAGVAAMAGLVACLGRHPKVSPLNALTLALACGAAQIGCYYLGMQAG